MTTEELFIDGNNLPQPLSKEEQCKLLQEAKLGSVEAKNKLITHNIRLVIYKVIHQFKDVVYDKKDLISIGNIGLIKAFNSFDETKGYEFTTYASKCVENEILMFLRKNKQYHNDDSIDRIIFNDNEGNELRLVDTLSDDNDFVENIEELETINIIKQLIENLPEREKEAIMMHFGFYNNQIYSQQEIADKMQISQSYISRLIIKTIKKMRVELKKQKIILKKENTLKRTLN